MEKLGRSGMLVGIQNGAAAVENTWSFLKKLNRVTTQPRNATPRYMPAKSENTCSYNKNLSMNVHSSFIPNTPTSGTTHM